MIISQVSYRTNGPLVYSCGLTLVAYRHGVRRENLTFWLFQKYVKSDLMSNNMKMNGDMRN